MAGYVFLETAIMDRFRWFQNVRGMFFGRGSGGDMGRWRWRWRRWRWRRAAADEEGIGASGGDVTRGGQDFTDVLRRTINILDKKK